MKILCINSFAIDYFFHFKRITIIIAFSHWLRKLVQFYNPLYGTGCQSRTKLIWWQHASLILFTNDEYICPSISPYEPSCCLPASLTIMWGHPGEVLRGKKQTAGLILGLRLANERRRYKITPSLTGWAQTWNQPWTAFFSQTHPTKPPRGCLVFVVLVAVASAAPFGK